MHNLTIFEKENFEEIKEVEKQTPPHFGYVYILEYGNMLKIGQSKKPYGRLQTLKMQCTNYADKEIGRFALTPKCTNYTKVEKRFHQIFAKYRKEGSELFDLSFEDAISQIESKTINYRDDSQEMERKTDAFLNSMKKFVAGGNL